MIYGYARVSTSGQDHAGQVAELTAAGCGQVFAETVSGAAGRKRPQLARVLAQLQEGDVLAVTRLDRLARSTRDALNTLAAVAAKKADFRSLREVWADTTTAHGRLMVTLMSGLAEFERELIMARTGEGHAAAKARGVKLGRRPRLTRAQVAFVLEARAERPPVPLGQLQRILGVSRSTICRATRASLGKLEEAEIAAGPRQAAQIDLEEFTN